MVVGADSQVLNNGFDNNIISPNIINYRGKLMGVGDFNKIPGMTLNMTGEAILKAGMEIERKFIVV